MVCLRFEPRAAGWLAQTKPLSYSGSQDEHTFAAPQQNTFEGNCNFWRSWKKKNRETDGVETFASARVSDTERERFTSKERKILT